MNPIQNLMCYLRRAFTKINPETDEAHAIAMLKALKSSPSILGDEVIIEEPIPPEQFSPDQKELSMAPFFDPLSDATDHLCTYSNEECALVLQAGEALSAMDATSVRDEAAVRAACPRVIEYRKIEGAAWDPRKRDTVIQLKFQLSSPAPLRLLKVPFATAFPHLAMMVRHVGKPFQSAHITLTNFSELYDHIIIDVSHYFVATFWVGPKDSFQVQIGTGYRSAHFPGVGGAPDHATRLLTRNLKGADLQEAYDAFEEAYGDDEGLTWYTVPVLLQLKDFIALP